MFRITHLTKFAAGVFVATAFTPNTASAGCQPTPYIGQVCWTAAMYCPKNYAEAQGQLLPISSNTTLFSLLGTAYGGDGYTTFGLPDLRGRSAIGTGQMNPAVPTVSRGQKRGSDILKIKEEHLPQHSHDIAGDTIALPSTLKANSTSATETTPVGNYMGVSTTQSPNYSTATANVTMAADITGTMTMPANATTTTAGTDYNFLHRPPSLGIKACIALQGIYPPRS